MSGIVAYDYYRTVDRLITHVRLQHYRENTLTDTVRLKIADTQSFLLRISDSIVNRWL